MLKRFVGAAFLAAFLSVTAVPVVEVAIFHVAAYAQASAPETIAQATSEGTKLTWAWGSMVSQWAEAIFWAVGSGILLLMRQLPGHIVTMLMTLKVDQLLEKAKAYGINATKGAVEGKTLTVDVGNEVVAQALAYALSAGPAWLIQWMGGPQEIVKKLWARLKLDADATAPDPAAVVQAARSL